MLVPITFKVTKKLSLLKGTITYQRNLVVTITKTITITVTFDGLETALETVYIELYNQSDIAMAGSFY